MDEKHSKIYRVLDIYIRLTSGVAISKTEEAQRFHIDQRSVQRDIDDLRAYFSERNAQDGSDIQVVYDRGQKCFVLQGHQSPVMSNSEILAVTKILLESRAFSKTDMVTILDKLTSGCVPQK